MIHDLGRTAIGMKPFVNPKRRPVVFRKHPSPLRERRVTVADKTRIELGKATGASW